MKLNNIYIIVIGVLLCLMTSVSDAQDLIKDTQRGVSTSNMKAPNRIAKEIARGKANIDFELFTPFQISEKDMRVKHQDYVSQEVYLALNTKQLNKIFDKKRDHVTMDIPVSDTHSFQVELMKVNILSDDFKVTTSSGKVLYADGFPGIFYRGIVKDDINSIVSISVFEGQVKGLISDDNGNYVLGEVKDQPDVYILYNDRDLKVSSNFSCGVTDEMETVVEEVREQQTTKSMNSGCIDVYIEADHATYQSHGNSEPNVINFATALFNQVSTLYANENISVQISDIHVWDTPDPYLADENTSQVLGRFGQNRPSFNGNLAHFISTRPLGGGIAWVDVLCGNLPYAVSANMESSLVPIPTYSWNVYVFAHEMGHNFGSSHTQRCVWNNNNTQIDDCGNFVAVNNNFDDNENGIVDDILEAEGAACYSLYPNGIIPAEGGTIMSYCHLNEVGINFNLGFGPQPGDLLRDRYNSAACRTDCAGSCVDNINITDTYSSGSNIDIEASETITANNKILNGANVSYDAGSLVTLTTGFHAHNGSIFHAFIDGCGTDGGGGGNTSCTLETTIAHSPACEAGAVGIDIVSSGEWTASPNVSWITLSQNNGGTPALFANYTANTGASPRTGIVTVTCGGTTKTTTITQAPCNNACTLETTVAYSPPCEAGTVGIDIVSSGEWTASPNVNWITLSPGSGSLELFANYTANTGSSPRTGIVTTTCGGTTKTTTITQAPCNNTCTLETTVAYSPLCEAGTVGIDIVSSGEWTASPNVNWITLSPGSGTLELFANYTANTGASPRTGIVTTTCGSTTKTTTITQQPCSNTCTAPTASQINNVGNIYCDFAYGICQEHPGENKQFELTNLSTGVVTYHTTIEFYVPFSGLTQSTSYTYRVRKQCASGAYSSWSPYHNFTTPSCKTATDVLGLANHPNPFLTQTTIEFSLPKDLSVTISITDVSGRHITTLLHDQQKHAGKHEVIFDGSNYPAGMYYYTIQAGEYVGTQKMILVK